MLLIAHYCLSLELGIGVRLGFIIRVLFKSRSSNIWLMTVNQDREWQGTITCDVWTHFRRVFLALPTTSSANRCTQATTWLSGFPKKWKESVYVWLWEFMNPACLWVNVDAPGELMMFHSCESMQKNATAPEEGSEEHQLLVFQSECRKKNQSQLVWSIKWPWWRCTSRCSTATLGLFSLHLEDVVQQERGNKNISPN